MAEILTIIVGLLDAPAKIKQYVIDPLKVQFSCLCYSNSILESLRAEVQSLEIVRASLQLDVDALRRNLEIIGPDVERWLERVNEIKKETDRILGAMPEVQQGCVNGSCLHLKLRYSISRKAKKMAKAVVEVRDAGKFDRVAHPAPPPGMEIIPVPSGTAEFESRRTKEEEIMAALRDESVYLIGICGMGGVGKTTMANKIWKRAKEEEKLFDLVAMAVVSQQIDRKRIQKKIAEYLGLKLEEDDISISAGHLRTRLMQEKSILIIIDDIWEALNLVELGIPSPREHKECKIILTSRHHGVCTGTEAKLRDMETTEMKATKILSLEVLTENEAWALFKSKAGSIVDRCDLHQIAKNVAKECKGLPLALVTIGCALAETNARKNPRPVWADALGQLQRSAPSNIEDVLEQVYRPLEWSYNHLKSDEARYLFLLCCLFPEDSRISLVNLLYYGVGLRIFSNVETLKKASDRVDTLVGMLESRYMLMDDGTEEGIKHVKMHDVIRDVAIHIASTGKHVFMISHDTELEDWPKKDSNENYTGISVTLRHDVTLPECINCPTVKLLHMEFDWRGLNVQVPDTFFNRMRELNVLDLGGIRSLPSSLLLLTNLRTLRLRWGKMEDVSMIGQLVKLEILDLSYSHGLQVLPKEIGGLDNLKSLDLRWCFGLREIAPGVISSLKRLEELFMLDSFKNWEALVEGKERRNASLVEEVAALNNLTALQLHIPDPKVLPQDKLHWPKLERFGIWIGTSPRREDYGDNNLILDLNKTIPLDHALIRKAHRLKLKGMGMSDEVISLIQGENQIKWISLEGCNNIKYLAEDTVFERLRSLSLSNCRNLEVISFGRSPLVGSFAALEYLELRDLCKLTHLCDQNICLPYLNRVFIRNCSSLQYVFLQSTSENLSRLGMLEIEQCLVLEAVFKAERGGTTDVVDPIVFPKLTILRLKELPSLNSFCKVVNGIDFPQSKHPYIESSHNHTIHTLEESSFFEQWEQNSDRQFLFPQKVFTNLVEMELSNINATKIFSSQIPIDSFSLKRLRIDNCPNLKVLFSPPILRNLRTRYYLKVSNCLKLEEVVGKEDEELQVAVKEPLFPELMELKLLELPNFKTFCHVKNDIELPKLKSIAIEDCQQMETSSVGSLSLASMENPFGSLDPNLATQIVFNREVFASLVEMELSNINATKIFSSQIPIDSFSQLERLRIDSCHNLKAIFFPTIFRNFRTLRKLAVSNCLKFEEIVGKEDKELQVAVKEPLFPELKELILSKLPNFKAFCHMKNDIELPQLESMTIEDCHEMGTLSMGFLSSPCLIRVFGLMEPDLATRIFSKKEKPRHDIHLKNNSFTLSARDLSISGWNSSSHWKLCWAKDSSGTLNLVGRISAYSDLRITGRFEMDKLSPGTLYLVVFEIMLIKSSPSRRGVKLELTQSEGITEVRLENLDQQPRGQGVEILAGEFTTGPDPIGDLEFSLNSNCISVELLVKGVTIRQKA